MRALRWDELPEARHLARLGKQVSRTAQGRLQWMLFYFFNARNAARTCRHFGVSRQTFYRWKQRFDRHDLRTLEGHSHRPRRVRQPTWAPDLAERVLALRKQYPRWGKDKLVVLLRKEKCAVSTSMVGRILAHLKQRGVLHEPLRPEALRLVRRKLRHRPGARRNSETLRRTRCGFPVGRCGSASSRHLAGGSPLPGGAHRAHALPHRGVPGGWRERVRRGMRGSLPAETNSPIRAAAAVSETERTCGAVQSHA